MRRFHLLRKADVSGVSGTGVVAEGVEFADGRCVLVWLDQHGSMGTYQRLVDVERIHGHDGRTVVLQDDEAVHTGRLLPVPLLDAMQRVLCGQGSEADRDLIRSFLEGGEGG